jgi:hypothetical protein
MSIAYWIISFYMFLNIAAFPVLTITLRNNLFKLFMPDKMVNFIFLCIKAKKKVKFEKFNLSYEVTKETLFLTFLILIPVMIVSSTLKD